MSILERQSGLNRLGRVAINLLADLGPAELPPHIRNTWPTDALVRELVMQRANFLTTINLIFGSPWLPRLRSLRHMPEAAFATAALIFLVGCTHQEQPQPTVRLELETNPELIEQYKAALNTIGDFQPDQTSVFSFRSTQTNQVQHQYALTTGYELGVDGQKSSDLYYQTRDANGKIKTFWLTSTDTLQPGNVVYLGHETDEKGQLIGPPVILAVESEKKLEFLDPNGPAQTITVLTKDGKQIIIRSPVKGYVVPQGQDTIAGLLSSFAQKAQAAGTEPNNQEPKPTSTAPPTKPTSTAPPTNTPQLENTAIAVATATATEAPWSRVKDILSEGKWVAPGLSNIEYDSKAHTLKIDNTYGQTRAGWFSYNDRSSFVSIGDGFEVNAQLKIEGKEGSINLVNQLSTDQNNWWDIIKGVKIKVANSSLFIATVDNKNEVRTVNLGRFPSDGAIRIRIEGDKISVFDSSGKQIGVSVDIPTDLFNQQVGFGLTAGPNSVVEVSKLNLDLPPGVSLPTATAPIPTVLPPATVVRPTVDQIKEFNEIVARYPTQSLEIRGLVPPRDLKQRGNLRKAISQVPVITCTPTTQYDDPNQVFDSKIGAVKSLYQMSFRMGNLADPPFGKKEVINGSPFLTLNVNIGGGLAQFRVALDSTGVINLTKDYVWGGTGCIDTGITGVNPAILGPGDSVGIQQLDGKLGRYILVTDEGKTTLFPGY